MLYDCAPKIIPIFLDSVCQFKHMSYISKKFVIANKYLPLSNGIFTIVFFLITEASLEFFPHQVFMYHVTQILDWNTVLSTDIKTVRLPRKLPWRNLLAHESFSLKIFLVKQEWRGRS